MTGLSRGVFALTSTKRRRFLWCAWWSGEPTESPFRAPDAWAGGARSREEAQRLAEAAAGQPLQEIEGRWAGAWVRVQAGLPAFVAREVRPHTTGPRPVNPYALLGVPRDATLVEVKAAFRKKALENHPDHGGTAHAFMAVKRAFDGIVRRRTREARSRGGG